MSILIDTSAWIEALRKDGNPEIQAQVKHVLLTGEAVTCAMIMLELWNGARGKTERAQIQRLADSLTFLDTDDAVWKRSWDMAVTCREMGLTIPSTDLLILAVAQHHRARLVHCDKHFELYLDSGA